MDGFQSWMGVFLCMFVCPQTFKGDMNGIASELKNGFNVGLEGVAYGQQLVNADTISLAEVEVFPPGLVCYHYAVVEQRSKTRALQLVKLVINLSLGEDN